MSALFRKVAEDFYVAPQLQRADFAAAREAGIRTVINNRPDGEAPDQLTDAEAAQAARAAGLAYIQVPVVSGGIFPDHIAEMREAVEAHEGPYLAYCRSGTRSCHLWALVAVQAKPVEEVIGAAAEAGYDLSAMRPLLEQIHMQNREA